jgi:hypothetical protein
MRATVFIIGWLCMWAGLSTMQAQQSPAVPVAQNGAGAAQPEQPVAAGDQLQQPAQSAPAPVDPKTGLPLTPAEQREREIDQYDPMKRGPVPGAGDPHALTDREQPTAIANQDDKAAPLPGSVAASDQAPGTSFSGNKPTADSLTDTSDTNDADYAGPAVLSRSYTLSRPMMEQQIKWRIALGLTYSWDFGEVPAVVVANSGYPSTAQSRAANWNLSGRHRWRHDQLGLTYNGNYSQYSADGLSGLNNTLNLDYSHVFSRRLSFQFVESAQDLSQNYALENPALESGSSIANINLSTSANVQLLGNTVRQSTSTASMTFHQTRRLSYNLSETYFLIGRTGLDQVGMTGQQVSADVNYRWTHKATVGAYYSYTVYQYTNHILHTDASSQGMIYSYAIRPRLQLQARIGATRIESLGYEAVPLSPQLAAILGEGSTIVNAYTENWTSDVSVQLVKDLRRNRSASLAYAHGESPGNGVLLASVQQTLSAGYAMSLLRRRVPVSVGFVYSILDATTQGNLGHYNNQTAYFSTSRALRHGVRTTFSVDYSRYEISGSPLLQHDLRISVGLLWSPGENTLLGAR